MSRNSPRGIQPGQHAVVTGGSSGLGLELATRLAARGINTTLLARDPIKLYQAAAQVRSTAASAVVRMVAVDVSDPERLDSAVAELAEEAGGIDILVNSAGILREGYFEDLAVSDFRDVMDVNFFGTLNAVRASLPYLKRSQGRIVNIASAAGLSGVFGYTAYCAAKHALVGFTDALRYELEPQGVRVQIVCPGEFDSPMVDELDLQRTPENRAHTLTIPKMSVSAVAAEVIRGIDADSGVVIPGRRAWLLVTGQRLAPSLARQVARSRIAKASRRLPA